MTKEEKKALKELIEGDLVDLYSDMQSTKNDLDVVTKAAQDIFDIKAGTIKKYVKMHYESNYTEKKNQDIKFYEDYSDIMEEN